MILMNYLVHYGMTLFEKFLVHNFLYVNRFCSFLITNCSTVQKNVVTKFSSIAIIFHISPTDTLQNGSQTITFFINKPILLILTTKLLQYKTNLIPSSIAPFNPYPILNRQTNTARWTSSVDSTKIILQSYTN